MSLASDEQLDVRFNADTGTLALAPDGPYQGSYSDQALRTWAKRITAWKEGYAIAAMELITFDDDGNCIGSNFMDYLLPTAVETPKFELGETVKGVLEVVELLEVAPNVDRVAHRPYSHSMVPGGFEVTS